LTDFNAQRLKAAGNPAELDRIMQEECRERYSSKLYDTLGCEEFVLPTLLSAEQCTSDALAEKHAILVPHGATVLDMTCGLGIDSFHIARRAAKVTMIDIDTRVAAAARSNSRALGLDNVEVVCADSIEWLSESDRHFDVIFIDPARRAGDGSRLFALSQCAPDVISALPLLKERAERIIIKASPMLDICHTLGELGDCADLIVYGTGRECKELTAIVPGDGTITAGGISFHLPEEKSAVVRYLKSLPSGFIYEPSPEVMKAAPFRLLSERFDIMKFDVNTHLYSSERFVKEFPGRIMKIETVMKSGNKAIRALRGIDADVAVRNYSMTAEALRIKLGIKHGGNGLRRLYGTCAAGTKLLITAVSLPECAGN